MSHYFGNYWYGVTVYFTNITWMINGICYNTPEGNLLICENNIVWWLIWIAKRTWYTVFLGISDIDVGWQVCTYAPNGEI